ncbi:MAG: T9SS type A sorting domain-containing protein [Ignavibacteria bacterium]|nr:T9SS type A sorting domain-containing protein [Ignavibacteria bacterium]
MKKIIFFLIIVFSFSTLFSQTPIPYQNFPIHADNVRWPFQKAGIPLIADLDKDGQKEIIAVALDYDGVVNPAILLYVIKSDGSSYPNFPKGYDQLIHDIACGDVNGDGYLDIVLRMTFSVDAIDRFGNSLPGFPISYSDGDIDPTKFISLYDLDNDGKLEIIISKANEVTVFNHDGSLRAGWPKYIPGKAKYNPAIGDVDGDGFAEMIFNSFKFVNKIVDSGAVNIFRHNGENFSNNFPIYFDSLYYSWSSSPSLYINRNYIDSTYIFIVADINGIQPRNHKFLKLNIYGNIISEKNYIANMDYGTLVIGDINRNGEMDFATGTQYGITFSAFDNILNRAHGSWPNRGLGEHWATGILGKINLSENLNIISNTWDAFNPNGYGNIFAYSTDGISLPWSPLRPFGIVRAVSIADLNYDGSVEIVATTLSNQGFYLYAWTIPGIPFTHEDFPWPQYGHDRYRTNQHGFIPPDEPVGIQPMNTNVPSSFNLYQNFPNPFNPATSIKFDIAKSGNVKLTVFDILGREVFTLVNENLNPGTYQVNLDGSNISSGVYFYKFSTEGFTEMKRMIMMK